MKPEDKQDACSRQGTGDIDVVSMWQCRLLRLKDMAVSSTASYAKM